MCGMDSYDFVSALSHSLVLARGREYREQQIKRERVAWAAMVGRSGEDTLVARARRATTDTRPTSHMPPGPAIVLRNSASDLTSQEQDLVTAAH